MCVLPTETGARRCAHNSGGDQKVQDRLLPTIDLERCTRCGLCIATCPTGAVELVQGRPVIVRAHDCAYCGLCEDMCPAGAIALVYEIVLSADAREKPTRSVE